MMSLDGDVEGEHELKVHGGAPIGIGINFVVAGLIGFLLQWGTTGSAVIIAYM